MTKSAEKKCNGCGIFFGSNLEKRRVFFWFIESAALPLIIPNIGKFRPPAGLDEEKAHETR